LIGLHCNEYCLRINPIIIPLFHCTHVFNQANCSFLPHAVSCYLRVSVTHVCAIVRSSSNLGFLCVAGVGSCLRFQLGYQRRE
jgi:hypothetical protein